MNSKRSLTFSQDASVEITVAPNAGACFGVVRAIKLGLQAADRGEKRGSSVYSFGPLIHNPSVVAELEGRGVKTVESTADVASGTVVLRSHGVKRELEAEMRQRGVQVVDATCPLVKKPQRIAQSAGEKGYFLLVVGDEKHPEIKGVLSYFGSDRFLVTYTPLDIAKIPAGVSRVAVLAQTTIEASVFDSVVEACRERFSEVAVYNTICDATSIRQTEAEALAEKADVMVVVGGRNSSNTKKLEKICLKYQTQTYLVETLEEIQGIWFDGMKKIGVTGGASTPQEYVDEVGDYIASLMETRLSSTHSA